MSTEESKPKIQAPYFAVSEFIHRTPGTEKLYDAEERVQKALELAARQLVKVLDLKKLDEYDPASVYWRVGITSEILNVLNAFDRNSSTKAVLTWLDNGRSSRLTVSDIRELRRIVTEWEEVFASELREK